MGQAALTTPARTRAGRSLVLWPLLLCAGCAACDPRINAALDHLPPHEGPPAVAYAVACPDVLEVSIRGRSDLSGPVVVDPDGRLAPGPLPRLEVEGATPAEVAVRVADVLSVARPEVQVRVAEHHSRHLFLFGQVQGLRHALPYQGPETVTELLHRTGGLTPGAALSEVHVVRPNVAAGKRPEVFPIDLEAILLKHDRRSDLTLEPGDQIYVGETLRSSWCRCLPPWLRMGGN
jgi:protein involved in polysaccharide export with SLBB domain